MIKRNCGSDVELEHNVLSMDADLEDNDTTRTNRGLFILNKAGAIQRMLEQMTNSPMMDYLGRGLHAANLRQGVISNNIANVNTPNFKKSDVVFESLLAKEMKLDNGDRLQLARTDARHLPDGADRKATGRIERQDTTTMRVDNNNVDIDVEMAGLAKNQIYYNSMAKELGSYITRVKTTITSK